MPKRVLLDELHVSVFVPNDLPDRAVSAIHRTLNGKGFVTELRQALLVVVRRHESLRRVRIAVTR